MSGGDDRAEETDRPARCQDCRTPLAGTPTVDVVIRRDDTRRTTVLCEDCARVDCGNCGHGVAVASALTKRADIWETVDLYECVKCGRSVPEADIVELRHENDAQYRKLVCGDCLKEISIPPNIRVVRDLQ